MADTYKINKALNLNTVNEGEPLDNVLVHGADNEVKSVPRSEFSGGSQNLQDVVTQSVITNGANYARAELIDSTSTSSSGLLLTAFNTTNEALLESTTTFFNTKNGTVNGEIYLSKLNKITGAETRLQFENPLADGTAVWSVPAKEEGTYTVASTSDFKTINGESIIGTGDIVLESGSEGGSTGLDAVLATKNHADASIILSDYYESPAYYQGLNLSATTGNTRLSNHYSGRVTGTLELKPGNLGLIQAAYDSSGNSASMEISSGGWGSPPVISFNKYINGQFLLSAVTAGDPLSVDDLTTKRYVDAQVAKKAAIESPVFTGTPTAPTAALGTNTNQIASTSFVTATDAQNVKLYGNQTISGNKTFTGGILANITGGNGDGLWSVNAGGGSALKIANQSSGIGINLFNNSGGIGMTIESTSASTSDLIIFKKNTSQTGKVDCFGNITMPSYRVTNLNTAPSSATDAGIAGEIRITANYIYVCTAVNTWVRTALTTW